MNFFRRCCKKSLKGLRISKKNKKHVIDKHFHRTDADYISFFLSTHFFTNGLRKIQG